MGRPTEILHTRHHRSVTFYCVSLSLRRDFVYHCMTARFGAELAHMTIRWRRRGWPPVLLLLPVLGTVTAVSAVVAAAMSLSSGCGDAAAVVALLRKKVSIPRDKQYRGRTQSGAKSLSPPSSCLSTFPHSSRVQAFQIVCATAVSCSWSCPLAQGYVASLVARQVSCRFGFIGGDAPRQQRQGRRTGAKRQWYS